MLAPLLKAPLSAQGGAFARIRVFHPELTAFRRDLHAHPELGFEEIYTSGRVRQALELCGVDEIHTGIGKTGVVGLIHGKRKTDQMIGLRADMDALPMAEHGEVAWKSQRPGLMHGCGHDGHTTMLVGAARYLAETRHFAGTAVLIFQPGEEGFAGAKAMIDDGLFERFNCREVYALHNSPELPVGMLGVTPGPMQAAVDRFEITVKGRGGHGARPHQCVDAVLVAAHIITAVQSVVSRNLSAFEEGVVSICAMQGGHPGAMSVMPGSVTLVGTVRSYDKAVQDRIEQRLTQLCASIAEGFDAQAHVDYQRVYPATINTAREAGFAADAAAALVGEERVLRDMLPSMGGEDFSFMLQARPGAYVRIGQQQEGGQPLHNSCYDFNDELLPLGSAFFASLIEQRLPLAA